MSAVRRAVRSVGRFVKRHWKKIVVAAAVVFTAGAAAGGLGAVKGAFASKGVVGGIGSTLKAGASAIGKVVTGQGLGAAKTAAQGALGVGKAAGAAGNVAAATASKAAATTGKAAATTSKAAVTTGKAATTAATTAKVSPMAASAAAKTAATNAAAAGTAGAAGAGVVGNAAGQVGGQIVQNAAGGGFMNSLGGAALIQGGIGALSSVLAGKAQDESEQAPLSYWGREARDGSGGLRPGEVSFAPAGVYGQDSSWQPRNSTAQRLLMEPTAPTGG